MTQPMEPQLSGEDYQLIEANTLGRPLFVSRMKPLFIHLLQASSVVFFLGSAIYVGILFLPNKQTDTGGLAGLVLTFLFPVGSILLGSYLLSSELPRARAQYLVVCERGLFERKKNRPVEVVFWQNLLSIRKSYNGYVLLQRGGGRFTLEFIYNRPGRMVRRIQEAVEASKCLPSRELYPPVLPEEENL